MKDGTPKNIALFNLLLYDSPRNGDDQILPKPQTPDDVSQVLHFANSAGSLAANFVDLFSEPCSQLGISL